MSYFPSQEFKRQVNSLPCPIDRCSLEGIPRSPSGWPKTDTIERITLSCAQNPNHYHLKAWWDTNAKPITFNRDNETLTIFSGEYRYRIVKNYVGKNIITNIHFNRVNGDGDMLEDELTRNLVIEADCFDFGAYDEARFVKRLKTLIFYQ